MKINKVLKRAALSAVNSPAFARCLTLLERRHVGASLVDAQSVDAQSVDAQSVDAQSVDAQSVDAQSVDAQPVDAQSVDAQSVDAQRLLRVLTYHRVDEPALCAGVYPRIMVSPREFERQMRYVAAHYNVISMAQVMDVVQGGGALPPRSLLITFDDAYVDFAENAWPILRRHGLPATLFVPTAFPDHPERVFWWDRLYHALAVADGEQEVHAPVGRFLLGTPAQRERAFSQLRDHVKTLPHEAAMEWVEQVCQALDTPPLPASVLSWQALRSLAQEGVTLGAHTRNHPIMTRVSPEVMRQEAVDSLHDLEREIGTTLPIFAYPSGGANAEVVRTLKQAGFVLAFLTGRGINDMKTADRLQMRRINVGQTTSLSVLRLQMHSWAKA